MEVAEFNFSESTFLDNSHVIPKITAQHGKEYVAWGDNGKNDYPDKLISLINNSALHNAIIVNKAMQVAGSGVEFDRNSENGNKTAEFLDRVNGGGEDITEVIAKAAFDFQVFNGFSLLVTWSKDWSQIASIEHIEFSKIRSAKVNEYGKVDGYFYSYDWTTYRPSKTFIPVFNPRSAEDKGKEYKRVLKAFEEGDKDNVNVDVLRGKNNTQILYYKPYRPDTFYYPLPQYAGAITSIEADIESDQYALHSLKNGMDIPYIVKIYKKLSPEQRREAAAGFYKMHGGAKKAGKPAIIFSEQKEDSPEIEKLGAPDVDKRYVTINDNSMQKILAGHRVTSPELVGILTAGKLGNAEIKDAQTLFYNTVIKPDQQTITKQINWILEVNQMESISIVSNNPFQTEEAEEEEVAEGKEDGNNSDIAVEEQVVKKPEGEVEDNE